MKKIRVLLECKSILVILVVVSLIVIDGGGMAMADDAVKPFVIPHMSSEQVEELKNRVNSTVLPDVLIDADAWEYGSSAHFMKELQEYWVNDFDWNAQVDFINRELPQYVTEIDGLSIHFAHIRSEDKGAVPLMMVHGWPGSFFECIKVAQLYTQTEQSGDPSFHFVCPSLPGYGYSSKSELTGMDTSKMASILVKLMARLGYDKYVAQGGDWGSFISQHIAAQDQTHCMGIHLNLCTSTQMRPKGLLGTIKRVSSMLFPTWFLSEEEVKDLAHSKTYFIKQSGYLVMQATKPHTIGYALTDSPMGLAAYIIEKFHAWSDKFDKFTKDELLANVMIYYTTRTITSSMRLYYEVAHNLDRHELEYIRTPVACALFNKEIHKPPKMWMTEAYNLVQLNRIQSGGHFAALEEPNLLAQDVIQFVKRIGTND